MLLATPSAGTPRNAPRKYCHPELDSGTKRKEAVVEPVETTIYKMELRMQNWEYKKLGDVCEIIAGQSPEGKYYNQKGNGTPFYQGKKDFGEKFLGEPTTWTTVETKIAIENDILMSVRAPVGDINICNSRVCIGRGLAAIRASKKIDEDYLFYFLLSEKPNITGKEGAVFASINRSDIANLDILVPPLEEQKRIVKILDEKFAMLETVKANAKANLQNAKDLFQSQLTKVFSNTTWEKKIVKEIGVTQTGNTPPTSDKSNYGNFIPFIKPGDINIYGNGELDYCNEGLSETGLTKGRLIKQGSTLMVCIGATIGKVGYAERNIACNQQINCITPNSDFEPRFIYYAMVNNEFQKEVLKNGKAAQATLPIINKSKWENLNITYPKSLSEQKRIVEQLDSLSQKVRSLEEIYTKQLANCDELKQAFLAKAFNGEL